MFSEYGIKPHAIVVIFPVTHVNNKQALRHLKDTLDRVITKHTFKPLILLSKCDTLLPNFNLSTFFGNGRVLQAVAKFQTALSEMMKKKLKVYPYVSSTGPREY